jgi:hypothetical protein
VRTGSCVSPDVDYDKALEEVHRTVGLPDFIVHVQTYLRERIKEVLTGC